LAGGFGDSEKYVADYSLKKKGLKNCVEDAESSKWGKQVLGLSAQPPPQTKHENKKAGVRETGRTL